MISDANVKALLDTSKTVSHADATGPTDSYVWLVMALLSASIKKASEITLADVMDITGLSQATVYRSLRRLKAFSQNENDSQIEKILKMRKTDSQIEKDEFSQRESPNPEKAENHSVFATNAPALTEHSNVSSAGGEAPFSPHTPLNPRNNNIYISSYSSSRKEDNVRNTEEVNLGREVKTKSTDSSNVTLESKTKGKPKEERKRYGEFVLLAESEYKTLVERYGEGPAKEMIETLDNYKGASGKRYKSDYRAILTWVVKRYEEDCYRSRKPIPYKQRQQETRRYDNPHDFFEGGADI